VSATRASETGQGLQVEDLVKHFPLRGRLPWSPPRAYVRAVDHVSFDVHPHEAVALVGESGCGKTTTARLILLLERPNAGRIVYEGGNVHELKRADLRRYRASVQAVFQDPWSSLNPRMRAKTIVAEPLLINLHMPRREREERALELFRAVGLDPDMAENYPHEFSGGMRQRLAVARALSLNPALIVLDEPVSALDVSIRAQIMNLLKDLQARFGMAYLLIAHDLATVRYLAHRVVVMYLGEVVEQQTSAELFARPLHPYTKALISAAVPVKAGATDEQIVLSSELPSPTDPPPGCRFHTRCPFAFDRCRLEKPALRDVDAGRLVACHLH
jgi:oligopeptide/dipeptide ABC transporter ATP-binding protein